MAAIPQHVVITHNIASEVNQWITRKSYTQIVLLVDANTRLACYPHVASALGSHTVIEIPAGEQNKNLNTCAHVWRELTRLQVDRRALLLVLGGGVAGDLGGFCAATYKRGIDFILMPTTLLSQVDASVGGKLGIDFEGFKNHIGVFQEPVATLIEIHFLKTLPQGELRSGFAEIVKHCLIGDADMWQTIRSKKVSEQDWPTLVTHSVAFKASVTQQDPHESGLRKILNFGHTVGHALESYFLETENRLLHGEAIAIGMIAESWLAAQKELISASELTKISDYIISVFGHVALPNQTDAIVALTFQDKKNTHGKIMLATLKGIGQAVWDVTVTKEDIAASLEFYRGLGRKS